jgi:hypothetical protein
LTKYNIFLQTFQRAVKAYYTSFSKVELRLSVRKKINVYNSPLNSLDPSRTPSSSGGSIRKFSIMPTVSPELIKLSLSGRIGRYKMNKLRVKKKKNMESIRLQTYQI